MIDARGLSCPQPVILIKNAVDKSHEAEYTLLTDNMACVENVSRYAKSARIPTEKLSRLWRLSEKAIKSAIPSWISISDFDISRLFCINTYL